MVTGNGSCGHYSKKSLDILKDYPVYCITELFTVKRFGYICGTEYSHF